MQRQVICITHSDLDGMAAAAVVKQRYPDVMVLITNYGRNTPLYKCKPGDLVFVTDFSLPYNEFTKLKERRCEIIWIDHHRDNYEQLANAGWSCEGVRRDDYCGAALTWLYLHPNATPEQMPLAIKLVNDYDLWTYNYGDQTKNFAFGIGLWDMRPGNKIGDSLWRDLLSRDDSERFKLIIKYGEHIREYIELFQDTVCKDLAYYTDISTPEGVKKILAITIRAGNSSVFDRMDKSEVDAVFQGQYIANIGKYRCSMYSPDNVKEILPIVKSFGGGGHPKAAGFQMNSFPLPPPPVQDPVPLRTALLPYQDLVKIKNGSIILKQWISKANSISMRTLSFHAEFQGYPALVCNHNNLMDLISVAPLATDCIDPDTALPAQIYIGFVLTNTGWYRCSACPTDTSTKIEDILKAVQTFNPDGAKTAEIIDDVVWWYQRDAPVHIPISDTPVNASPYSRR